MAALWISDISYVIWKLKFQAAFLPFPFWTFVIIVDFIQFSEFEAQAFSLALKYQQVEA